MQVDWLELTHGKAMTPGEGWPMLWPGVWTERRGGYGYKRGWTGPHGALWLTDGTEDMGTHVSLPSATLHLLEDEGVPPSMALMRLCSTGWQATRLDVAADWFTADITPDALARADTLGHVTHTSHGKGVRTEDRATGGVTVTWGRRGRQTYVRAYDKLREQGLQSDRVPPMEEWWTRVEWEFRKPAAPRLAVAVAVGEWREVARACVTALAWRDVDATPRRPHAYQAPLTDAWTRLMSVVPGPRPVALARPPTEYDAALAYLVGQVAPMLAAVVDAATDPAAVIGGLLAEGRRRRTDRHVGIMASGPAGLRGAHGGPPDGEWLG